MLKVSDEAWQRSFWQQIFSFSSDTPDMDEMAEKFKESKENGTELDPSMMTFTSPNTIEAYNTRMSGVFQDMYDLKYI